MGTKTSEKKANGIGKATGKKGGARQALLPGHKPEKIGEARIEYLKPHNLDMSVNIRKDDPCEGGEWDDFVGQIEATGGNTKPVMVDRVNGVDYCWDGSKRSKACDLKGYDVKALVQEWTALRPVRDIELEAFAAQGHIPQHWTRKVRFLIEHHRPDLASVRKRHELEKAGELRKSADVQKAQGSSDATFSRHMLIARGLHQTPAWLDTIRDKGIAMSKIEDLCLDEKTPPEERDAEWAHLRERGDFSPGWYKRQQLLAKRDALAEKVEEATKKRAGDGCPECGGKIEDGKWRRCDHEGACHVVLCGPKCLKAHEAKHATSGSSGTANGDGNPSREGNGAGADGENGRKRAPNPLLTMLLTGGKSELYASAARLRLKERYEELTAKHPPKNAQVAYTTACVCIGDVFADLRHDMNSAPKDDWSLHLLALHLAVSDAVFGPAALEAGEREARENVGPS